MDLAYTASGNGAPFVLIHAFPLSQSMWDRNLARLSENNYVIAPSLRGFGKSAVAPSATMDEMAADVAELMDRLGVKKAAIGGLSMGGYAAFAFVRKYPERVRALVLADTRMAPDSAEAKAGRGQFADAVKTGGPAVAADKLLPKLLTAGASTSLKDLVRSTILKNRAEGIAAALLGMRDRPDSTATAEAIKVPTLIVCGEKDELTPVADSKAMQAKIKGSQYVELAGAGHLSNMEAPAEFSEAVAKFLEGLPDRAEYEPRRHTATAAAAAPAGEGDRD